MDIASAEDEYADIAYEVTAIPGSRVGVVEVFFWRDLGDEALQRVVTRLLGRLMSDEVTVVLLEARSIRHVPNTTQSFSFRLGAQLDHSGVTFGLYNYHTSHYEIQTSHSRRWPVGSISRQAARKGTAYVTPPDPALLPPIPAAITLQDHGGALAELQRLHQLLKRPNQSPDKRQRRQERLAELRQRLGLVDGQ